MNADAEGPRRRSRIPPGLTRAIATGLRLLVIPAVVLILALGVRSQRGPFWLGSNSDPSYVYALNCLRVLEGQPPTHLDHPGLTIHILGAASFWTTHFVTARSLSLVDDVLTNTEWYLGKAVLVLLVMFVLSLVLVGSAALKASGHWIVVWIAQAGPLLSPSALFELTDFKPEPFLYVVAMLLAAATWFWLVTEVPDGAFIVLSFGVLVGLAIATKLTALSLIVLPLVLFRSRRARASFVLVAGLTFGLCAIPALANWRLAVAFVWRVSSGHGLYGVNLFTDERPYAEQWNRIVIEEVPSLGAVLAATGVLVLALRRGRSPLANLPIVRALAGLLAATIAQLILVARHPYQPRYLLPALALTGLMLALSVWILRYGDLGIPRGLGVLLTVSLLVGITAIQAPRFFRRGRQLSQSTSCQKEARQRALASGCCVVTYYRASSPALALFQADQWAQQRFSERLASRFPREAFLTAAGGLTSFSGQVELQDLRRPCLVLQGSPGGPRRPFSPVKSAPFADLTGASSVSSIYACSLEEVFRPND